MAEDSREINDAAAALSERLRIVEWLRNEADENRTAAEDAPYEYWHMRLLQRMHDANTWASAIERGEHLKETK